MHALRSFVAFLNPPSGNQSLRAPKFGDTGPNPPASSTAIPNSDSFESFKAGNQSQSQTKLAAGDQAYRQNNFPKAVSLFSESIALNKTNVLAYNKRGVARSALKDYGGAIADYTMAIALDPRFYNAYLNRGNLWVRANDPERALQDYSQAIEINPDNRAAYENRSELYSSLGLHELSLADKATVIRLQQAKNASNRPAAALYPKRIALVLANDDYPGQANDLEGGPIQDASKMTQELRHCGFSVMNGFNLTGPQTKDRLQKFVKTLHDNPGAVSVIYYSGHGGSIGGNNFLIPVNFDGQADRDFRQDAVSVDFILNQLKKSDSAFNMIFLDACRTPLGNPASIGVGTFFRAELPSNGGRPQQSLPQAPLIPALQQWETEASPGLVNTWIEYASRPEKPALQSEGEGLYTKYLLQYMMQPGLNLEEVSMYTNYAQERDPQAIRQNQHARTQTDLAKTGPLAESFYFQHQRPLALTEKGVTSV